MKKTNEFFAYAYFTVGALKVLLIILILMKLTTNLTAIFSGGYVDADYYSTLGTILGYSQIILLFASIIMTILNRKNNPVVIKGYLWGLLPVLIELITPRILSFYMVFVECSMYMKAGTMIKNENSGNDSKGTVSKEMIEETDWFYASNVSKEANSIKNKKNDLKKEKKILKIEEEIGAWKELLDLGEIDKQTCDQEINRLVEKENKIKERN